MPGGTPGRNGTDLAELQFFRFDQSYDYLNRSHGLRLLAKHDAAARCRCRLRLEDLDLDLRGDEQARGTSAAGASFETSRAGSGDVRREPQAAGSTHQEPIFTPIKL